MTTIDGRRRSVLFLPASNPRAIAKLATLACDAAILDLEDAVAPEAKAAARDAATATARDRAVAIRINALDTPWGRDDAAAAGGAMAVVLPKVSSADDLHAARDAVGADGPPLWAMIETCGAVLRLGEIVGAAAAARCTVLIAGTNDLAKEMRCRPGTDRAPLVPVLAQIVIAGRAAGLTVLDGVCNAIGDAARLAAECAQGAMLGFDGKTLIHPGQIDAANAAFGPDAAEIAWARAVVAAFAAPEAAGKGAIRLDGAMVERLHLAEAKRILAMA
ncbi:MULTISPECIES: CoA ester lyase [unclassified Sphingomonas]|jgi:citrate lyase subunit beta / citryl-CoA lyase|uniref:HpcH/HpaI aldolase/citrate lyase family protein n=1 Tax=unclassified Sphingomonas TaxID=196159 RepID=UPI000E1016B2|nr:MULTISPECIES: CoA ester lyase [unclassified Sphingomonas]AXJ95623.1 CoA ester lyase [Sphingomonas sp. FARSPH]